MSSRISQWIRRRRNQCRWANARSTTQRWVPSPDPCSVAAAGDQRFHAESPDQAAVLVVVVAAIGRHPVVFKLVESAQTRWSAVNAFHLVALVRAGARFERGRLVERPDEDLVPTAA
jgi:hypothetical protein